MYKISLVFWRMGELGILLSIFTDLYHVQRFFIYERSPILMHPQQLSFFSYLIRNNSKHERVQGRKPVEEIRYVILLSIQYQKLNFCCKSKTNLRINIYYLVSYLIMFSPLNLRAAAVGPGPEIELKPGRRPDWTRAYSDMGRLLPAAETGRLCMADPEPPLKVN